MKLCEKKTYKTRTKAWSNAVFYFQRYGTASGAYKCNKCNKFHLSRKAGPAPPWCMDEMLNWFQVSEFDEIGIEQLGLKMSKETV